MVPGIIGTKELLELVKSQNLIENLCERELNQPEGAGFDLRAGAVYRLGRGETILGIEKRIGPEVGEPLAKHGVHKEVVLRPGVFYLVETLESLNLPENICALFQPRSTLQRSGITFHSATGNPGYKGKLTFGLYNAGGEDFILELGARFSHAIFYRTGDNVRKYGGQWQGGRVSLEGKSEVQV
ncbi:MAG: 2'-deoxycytidine 5'-triphosphate deaminase [archaeon]|nr:2'-deoxycytidine 5'-triphosphate deaminase [archaeon]